MQDIQLQELIDKNIAIESMPTSNVRIGFYNDYSEHHLFRWLGLNQPDNCPKPIVCLGSDDPGIFATSLRAEYYHVYRVLTSKKFNQSPTEAIDTLERLHRNSERFRFTPEDNLRMR